MYISITWKSRFKKLHFSFPRSNQIWNIYVRTLKNKRTKKLWLKYVCMWVCKLRSFLNRDFTVLSKAFKFTISIDFFNVLQRITASVNSVETKRLLMDLDISMRTSDCPYTVHFYGAMFREGNNFNNIQ